MVVLQPFRPSVLVARHAAPQCGLPDTLKSQLGPFASRDIERQVEKNWAALAKIYGDSETARVAVLQNRQVVPRLNTASRILKYVSKAPAPVANRPYVR